MDIVFEDCLDDENSDGEIDYDRKLMLIIEKPIDFIFFLCSIFEKNVRKRASIESKEETGGSSGKMNESNITFVKNAILNSC